MLVNFLIFNSWNCHVVTLQEGMTPLPEVTIHASPLGSPLIPSWIVCYERIPLPLSLEHKCKGPLSTARSFIGSSEVLRVHGSTYVICKSPLMTLLRTFAKGPPHNVFLYRLALSHSPLMGGDQRRRNRMIIKNLLHISTTISDDYLR